MTRLAIVASHPIQYQAPLFRELARHVDVEVFFCHRQDARGQADAGFGVEFEWDVPVLEGYRFTWLKNVSTSPDVSRFYGCDTPEIATRLREGRFDACLISGWYLKCFMQALLACRLGGIAALSRGDSQLQTSRSTVWRLAKYFPYRALLSQFDAHLYVGQNNRAYLRHYGVPDSRLFFSPHFVDTSYFATRATVARESGAVAQLRRDLGIPESAMVFAFAGKLLPNKRPQDFVEALHALHAAGRPVHGLVIGSGPLAGVLQTMVASRGIPVSFAGFRNQSEMPACLASADALVLPSEGETWGLVVNEAMACDLPVIVSHGVGCGPDLVDEGRTGYRFPVAESVALAQAMSLMADALIRDKESMVRAVREKTALYTAAAAAAGLLQAVEAVAADRRRRAAA